MKKEIKITKNGPYVVFGSVPLSVNNIINDSEGNSMKWKEEKSFPVQESYTLCRCGVSKNKPFCDGSHVKSRFDGTETADNKPYLKSSDKITGPDLILRDKGVLCAGAGFCDRKLGTWASTEQSDNPKIKKMAIQQACDCPSGRLTVYNKKTGKEIEPEFKQSICLCKHPSMKLSGPLWVRGKIPIESVDGKKYELRNRITLCRCGESKNKPFCDASHFKINFSE